MKGNPAPRADVPFELSSAARLQLAELLRSELQAACATAIANGVTPAQLAELIAERRSVLMSIQRDAVPGDDRGTRAGDQLRIVQQD
jgi:hypothetical protein